MARPLTPAEDTRLRVKFDTEYEFLLERNLFGPEDAVSHRDIHEAKQHLAPWERKALDKRMRDRMERLDELLAETRKTYTAPKVRHEDLVSGVNLQREDARYR